MSRALVSCGPPDTLSSLSVWVELSAGNHCACQGPHLFSGEITQSPTPFSATLWLAGFRSPSPSVAHLFWHSGTGDSMEDPGPPNSARPSTRSGFMRAPCRLSSASAIPWATFRFGHGHLLPCFPDIINTILTCLFRPLTLSTLSPALSPCSHQTCGSSLLLCSTLSWVALWSCPAPARMLLYSVLVWSQGSWLFYPAPLKLMKLISLKGPTSPLLLSS